MPWGQVVSGRGGGPIFSTAGGGWASAPDSVFFRGSD